MSTCRLADLVKPPADAILQVIPSLPDSLIDSAAVGSIAHQLGPLEIKNGGGGDLIWHATTASVPQNSWISFQPDSGKAGDPMMVVFNPDSLATGVYRDTVVIKTASGVLQTPVRFTIHPCRDKQIAVDDSVSGTLNAADCGAPHGTAGQFAKLYSFVGAAPESTSIVLSPGFTGKVSLDTAPTATGVVGLSTIPPLATKTDCNGDSSIQCIYYFRLPSTTKYYVEVTSPSRGDSGSFQLRVLHPGRSPDAPSVPDQRQPDTVDAIPPGGTTTGTTVLLQAMVSDPDPVDSLQLEAEIRDVSSPFLNQATTPSPGPKVANGQIARVLIAGLSDMTSYHWQVRTVDISGRRGNWTPFPASPAFAVQTGHNPGVPTALNQYQSDGITAIPTGGNTTGNTVVFKGQVTDPDAGNTVQLQIEAQPVGTTFTNVATQSSAFVGIGSTATVSIAGLNGGIGYHWQAQTVDNTGRQSGWVPFGGNPESAADFVVQVPPQRLAFLVQPAVDTSGRPIHPAVQVAVQDQNGNTITSFTGPVTMAISTNPPGNGILSGTNPVNATSGVATFSNLVIDKAGTGYTLQASINAGTIFSPLSSAFNVVAGPATKLAFTGQPSNTPATSPITPPVVVTAQDAAGNTATSFTGNVTVNLATNPPGNGILSGTLTLAAVAGQAQFGNLSIDKVANGYQLGATSVPPLTAATSASFSVTNIGLTHLSFSSQPTNTGAGVAINNGTGGVVVTAVDDVGQPVTSYTGLVTIAIGNNPGGGTLSGTKQIQASGGVAMFTTLSIDKVGTNYTLTATGPGASAAASNSFNITVGPMSQLVFTTPPPASTIAGVAITPPVQVSGADQFGNVVTSFTGNVSMTIATGPGTFTPTSTTTVAAVSGMATFSNLHIRTAGGGYSLQASTTAPALTSLPSNTFSIIPAPAASLTFTNQPGATTAGVAINSGAGGVQVTARDSVGNVATGFTNNVTMAIASGPGTTLSGTPTVAAQLGVATFNNLRIRTPVGTYTLQASSSVPALASPASAPFVISVGPATRDTFNVQPANTAVLDTIQKSLGGMKVWVTDSIGNLVTTDNTHTITMTIFSGPSATLGGMKVKTVQGGIATFADLTIDKLGTFTLNAVSNLPGNPTDISVPFDIIPGPAKTLVFKTQPPASVVAGSPFGATVAALDVVGDTATGFGGNVTLSLNPSGGGLGGGPLTVAAASGIATFSNLTVAGTGTYNLIASTPALPSGPVTNGTSNNFTVQPGGVSAINSTIISSTASMTACKNPGCTPNTTAATITVTAKDAGGNAIGGQTVTLSSNGNGDNIIQPASVTDVNGVATGTISDTTVEALTVRATIGATLINASAPISVTPSSPAVLLFVTQPRDTTAGAPLRAPSPGVQVRVLDQFRNQIPGNTSTVTITILNNPGGATLSGTSSKAAVNDVASFTNLSLNKVAAGYTLLASGLPTQDTSSTFAITAGQATQLSITTQPSTSAQSGIAIPQQPAVQLLDALNNPVNTSGVLVTAALATGSGSLTNATATTNSSGQATFSGLAISGTAGSGYSLNFTTTSPNLTSANSNSITLSAGTASKLGFFTQPSNTTGGVAIPSTVQVEIEDASGNRVTSGSATITMGLGTNPKNGHLTGTLSAGTSSGVASFSNLVIDSAATGYTLSATGGGFTAATSNTFNVTVGSATKLGFRIQPPNTGGGSTMATVQVEIRDAGGNRVTSGSRNISLAITTNPNNGTLSGTFSNVASSVGLVSFTDLSIDSAGTGYVLQATASGGPPLTSANSNPFNITVGAAAQLIYLVEPSDPQSNAMAITPAIQVEVADLGGNRVTSSTAMIAIDFGTNAGGALSGTLSVQAMSGVALFDNVIITGPASGYTLVATSAGLAGTGPSKPFTVN